MVRQVRDRLLALVGFRRVRVVESFGARSETVMVPGPNGTRVPFALSVGLVPTAEHPEWEWRLFGRRLAKWEARP